LRLALKYLSIINLFIFHINILTKVRQIYVLLLISYTLFRIFAYMAILLIKTIKTFQYLVTSPLKFKDICFFSLLNNARPFISVAYLFRTLIACESRDFCVITTLIADSVEYLLNSKHKVISLFILEYK